MSASTSCNERAERLLRGILGGKPADTELARSLAREDCSPALFRIVVEGLADRFERRLCDAYASIFSELLADLQPSDLLARYNRIRVPRVCTANPKRVFVLSRVTLGADIAVTGILLRAARLRFPDAQIVFVGGNKSAELFGTFDHIEAPYPRTGSLRDRVAASRALAPLLNVPDSIVLDPDSRLTQLGILPICEEERYFFFESRCFAENSTLALSQLAAQWCGEVLGIPDAAPHLSFPRTRRAGTAVSFGVGENPAKRLGDAFEADLLKSLPGPILIDRGAGGEEGDRVDRAIFTSGVDAETWTGSFAGFARRIAQSALYVGYDSAGQHAAAALATPLVTVFAGQVSQRMFERWKPVGSGPIAIVNADKLHPTEALRQTQAAIKKLSTADTSADAIENRE